MVFPIVAPPDPPYLRSPYISVYFPYLNYGKNLEKYLLQNQQANFNQTWYKSSLVKGNSKLFK